jgi:hypothetical protein
LNEENRLKMEDVSGWIVENMFSAELDLESKPENVKFLETIKETVGVFNTSIDPRTLI